MDPWGQGLEIEAETLPLEAAGQIEVESSHIHMTVLADAALHG